MASYRPDGDFVRQTPGHLAVFQGASEAPIPPHFCFLLRAGRQSAPTARLIALNPHGPTSKPADFVKLI
jgi:hypothetical protein